MSDTELTFKKSLILGIAIASIPAITSIFISVFTYQSITEVEKRITETNSIADSLTLYSRLTPNVHVSSDDRLSFNISTRTDRIDNSTRDEYSESLSNISHLWDQGDFTEGIIKMRELYDSFPADSRKEFVILTGFRYCVVNNGKSEQFSYRPRFEMANVFGEFTQIPILNPSGLNIITPGQESCDTLVVNATDIFSTDTLEMLLSGNGNSGSMPVSIRFRIIAKFQPPLKALKFLYNNDDEEYLTNIAGQFSATHIVEIKPVF